ncbi:DUF2730 family protein [Providencia hangzhouensis]|uniref:DUF2730 family protein n=2 Tax=Providencia TaxID=586 RepID=A0ABT9ALU2_9GAMM|nr:MULTISPECIES: DUF2730 family protein [Providencia]MDO7829472.1 DUF2730 family protein [Providencia sp. CRE-138-0026]MDO7855549.1 DUF2730 family protein [Providencia sp. CRE-138-0111]CAB5646018.1 Protein of uncharacterised function (DUF2730) [Providencia rettgeri]CAB5712916.1 Protein of uncharacterised function (DUF2730) [Providencia rettgeri]CAC9220300.1 Protein of uncharacterised function (DUF2730) [Providencia rettgeri]
MLDAFKEHWSMIYSVITFAGGLVLFFLSKTYAKRDDVEILKTQVRELQSSLESLPNRQELHNLQLDIASLRGEIKAISPELRQLRHMSDLLLQNELKEKK